MCSEVDHGVDALALPEPGIERDIAVQRWAGDVVVALLPVRQSTAVRLEKDADVSGSYAGKAEAPIQKLGSLSGAPQVSASVFCRMSGRLPRKSR